MRVEVLFIRPIEFNGVISRLQDISPIKQNEDTKPMVEQQNIMTNQEKTTEVRQEQVNSHDDSDMDRDYDSAKGEGNSEYEGNKGKKKKKDEDEDGKVMIKGHNVNFDIKI